METMTCSKCGDCCRFFKLKIEGLDKDGREWLMSHKGVMMSSEYVIFEQPCIHLNDDGACAIYEKRFNACRLMQPNSPTCKEAKTVCRIMKKQYQAIK